MGSLAERIKAFCGVMVAIGGVIGSLLKPELPVWARIALAGAATAGGGWILYGALRTRSRLVRPDALQLRRNERQHLLCRDRDIEQLVDHCQRTAILHVTGESGVGKSAILRAGLFTVLRDSQSLFPLLIEYWGTDWSRGPSERLGQALFQQLSPDEREKLGLRAAPAAEQVFFVLKRLPQILAKKPLVIFDQFDDYLLQHRAHFFSATESRWRTFAEISRESEFWSALGNLAKNGRVTLVTACRSDLVAGLSALEFAPSVYYELSRLSVNCARAILEKLMPAQGEAPVVSHPEAGWQGLRERLISDITSRGTLLPSDIDLALRGLGTLHALTLRDYYAAGGLAGLIARTLDMHIAHAARHASLTQLQVLSLLRAAVDPAEAKSTRLTDDKLRALASDSGGNLDHQLDRFRKALQHLERSKIVRRVEPEREQWTLDHDTCAIAILSLERGKDPVVADAMARYQEYSSETRIFRKWTLLLTPRQQRSLMLLRLGRRFRYQALRRFALLSLVRWIPHAAVVGGLATAGILQLELMRHQESYELFVTKRRGSIEEFEQLTPKHRRSILAGFLLNSTTPDSRFHEFARRHAERSGNEDVLSLLAQCARDEGSLLSKLQPGGSLLSKLQPGGYRMERLRAFLEPRFVPTQFCAVQALRDWAATPELAATIAKSLDPQRLGLDVETLLLLHERTTKATKPKVAEITLRQSLHEKYPRPSPGLASKAPPDLAAVVGRLGPQSVALFLENWLGRDDLLGSASQLCSNLSQREDLTRKWPGLHSVSVVIEKKIATVPSDRLVPLLTCLWWEPVRRASRREALDAARSRFMEALGEEGEPLSSRKALLSGACYARGLALGTTPELAPLRRDLRTDLERQPSGHAARAWLCLNERSVRAAEEVTSAVTGKLEAGLSGSYELNLLVEALVEASEVPISEALVSRVALSVSAYFVRGPDHTNEEALVALERAFPHSKAWRRVLAERFRDSAAAAVEDAFDSALLASKLELYSRFREPGPPPPEDTELLKRVLHWSKEPNRMVDARSFRQIVESFAPATVEHHGKALHEIVAARLSRSVTKLVEYDWFLALRSAGPCAGCLANADIVRDLLSRAEFAFGPSNESSVEQQVLRVATRIGENTPSEQRKALLEAMARFRARSDELRNLVDAARDGLCSKGGNEQECKGVAPVGAAQGNGLAAP